MTTPQSSSRAATPRQVLVAEDETVIRALLSAALDGIPDCEIRVVPDGEEFLAAARQLKPDLVLVDVLMPRMSGYEVCAALHSDPGLSDVIVVMISATSARADIERLRAAGADHFVQKPFVPIELRSKVIELLDSVA